MSKTFTVETLDSKDIAAKVIPPPYNRSLQLILDATDADNAGNFTFLLSTLFPYEGKTDYHVHPVDELIFICSGYGYSVDDNGEKTPLTPGSVIYAKAGLKHQCVNQSPETMKMACIYIPALPEEIVAKIRDTAA